MKKDTIILRELASRYFELANSDINAQTKLLHKQVNDLKATRPIVLIDEIPWHEMNIDDELTLLCEENRNRGIEFFFRSTLYRWKHMRADMVLPLYFGVQKAIHSTGSGVSRMNNENEVGAKSHTYVDQLQTDADIDKITFETITYDEVATMKSFCDIADIFGDILPVKITGEATGYGLGCKSMDDVVSMRGLDTLFFDFIERPEFLHKIMSKLTDVFIDKIRQYNELELFDTDAHHNHSTSALTNDLHPDHLHPNSKDLWGRGLAQILASVSPSMQDEFDTQYMIKAMEPFGLVYFGCCEPLHNKIDILEQIPNLRKISITPWADVDIATEIMGKRYVVASKPNPSALALAELDEDSVRKEITKIVSACKRNGCSADLVLKDITTVANKPQNLFKWQEIAMEVVTGG